MSLFELDEREKVGLAAFAWALKAARLGATVRAFTVHKVDDAGHSKQNLSHPETEFLAAVASEERRAFSELALELDNARQRGASR